MNIFNVFAGTIAGYFLIALYNTLLKEKSMVEEGGDPLPTSAYVFLTLKHIIWIGVALISQLVIPAEWFYTSSEWLVALLSIAFILVAYTISTIIEVVIRVVVVYFKLRSLKKVQKKTEVEGAE